MAHRRDEYLEDYSDASDESEVYEPCKDDKDLVVEEEAYHVLEYVSLDWPAQSIDVAKGFTIVLGTNPVDAKPGMVSVDLFYTDGMSKPDRMKISKRSVGESYNKVRVNGETVYCLSDDKLVLHDLEFNEVYRRDCNEPLGYGLCFSGSGCVFGTRGGEVSVNDWKYNEVMRMKIHEGSIEGLCHHDNMLFSASCDYSVALTDLRTKERIFSKKYDSDINAIDFNGCNLLAFGDDEGTIRLMDIRNYSVEEIGHHKSPVSCLKWRDGEVLASGSDEQVCIWDTTLDLSEEGGYLLFVHQGQRFYKDVTFCRGDNNYVITTSVDGLCVFRPISFELDGESVE